VSIQFHCTQCKRPMKVDERHAGSKVRCPGCRTLVGVPALGAPAPKKRPTSAPAPAKRAVTAKQVVTEEAEEPPVRFGGRRDSSEQELDMTPMVDVTFLLLIFFMVTAAFSMQKSLEVAPPDQEDSAAQSRQIDDVEKDDDYCIVRIYKDNTITVDDVTARSKQDLIVKLREARQGTGGSRGPSSLLVLAHEDARHEKVIMALDAGNAVGMENIRRAAPRQDDDF